MDKISIVIPIYNIKEEYIKRCINSVVNQTYKNIEIILIDDGSEKQYKEIYKKLTIDKRIKLITQKNQGVSVARNNGIKKSTGKWIMFVDADDYLELNSCDKFIKRIKKYGDADIFIAKPYVIEYDKKISCVNYYKKDKIISETKDREELLASSLSSNSKYQYCEAPWAKLFKRKFIIKNSLHYNKDLKIGEDLLFNFESYTYADQIIYVDEFVYNYYLNNSVSKSYNKDYLIRYQRFIQELSKLMEKTDNEKKLYNEFNCLILWILSRISKYYFFNKKNNKKNSELKKEFYTLINQQPWSNIKNIKYDSLSTYLKIFYNILRIKNYYLIGLLFRLEEKILEFKIKND